MVLPPHHTPPTSQSLVLFKHDALHFATKIQGDMQTDRQTNRHAYAQRQTSYVGHTFNQKESVAARQGVRWLQISTTAAGNERDAHSATQQIETQNNIIADIKRDADIIEQNPATSYI